jgi:transposase-like protein
MSCDVTSVAVRWYLRNGLSCRDKQELLVWRGGSVDHVTVYGPARRFTPGYVGVARHAPNGGLHLAREML